MIILPASGGSGKSFFMNLVHFSTALDRVTACAVCPVDHPTDKSDYDNSVRTLIKEYPKSHKSKLTSLKVTFLKKGLGYYSIDYLAERYGNVDCIVHPVVLDGKPMYSIVILHGDYFITAPDVSVIDFLKPRYQGLPLLKIGEGYCDPQPSVVEPSSKREDRLVLSPTGMAIYNDSPFYYLNSNRCLVDSISQLVVAVSQGAAMSFGLSTGLVRAFADTNSSACICSYAPIFNDLTRDPLLNMNLEGYTDGSMFSTLSELSTDVDYTRHRFTVTSRAPWPSLSPINVSSVGVDRYKQLPLYINGTSFGNDFVKTADGALVPIQSYQSVVEKFNETLPAFGRARDGSFKFKSYDISL